MNDPTSDPTMATMVATLIGVIVLMSANIKIAKGRG